MGLSKYYVSALVVIAFLGRQLCCSAFTSSSSLSMSSSSASPASSLPQHVRQEKKDASWRPKVASLEERRYLRGLKHDTEHIGSVGFHHVEFYCGDARCQANQFSLALGMPITGSTGLHTGNDKCVSYGLDSGGVRFLITAPYRQSSSVAAPSSGSDSPPDDAPNPLPGYSPSQSHDFFAQHGLAARAIGIEVKDAREAFEASTARGARPVLQPTDVPACRGQTERFGNKCSTGCSIAEVELYGDVVLRFVSFSEEASSPKSSIEDGGSSGVPFLPHLSPVTGVMSNRKTFGLKKIDHAVGNVPDLSQALDRVVSFTGFHEFAEFTAEDVGTVDSGLNSVVLASDSEDVLLPLNEPTVGKRKSQIQTYLEQNDGPGLQHLALKTDDIFETISLMRKAEQEMGGFELMKRPSDGYYRELPDRLGDKLTPEQYDKVEKLGILADADDEGILLQIFTKPVGDRPTFFFEIIQRIGCLYTPEGGSPEQVQLERPGCGGFGQGNFRELFKSIEEHEKTLKV